MSQIRASDGPWRPESGPEDEESGGPAADRDSLARGMGGLARVVAEIGQSGVLTAAEEALSAGIVARLSALAPTRAEPSLYVGLGGDATALKLLAPGSERVALARLAGLMTPAGWSTTPEIEPGSVAQVTDLIQGSAGVVLAAIWAGGEYAA